MKTLVAYYSQSGNNKYLAAKIADTLKSDIEEIKPRLRIFPFLILFSLIKSSMGIKTFAHDVKKYDRIILCGPIWMGLLVSPLRDFINKNRRNINKLYFATCCGAGDDAKDKKFGYGGIFKIIKSLLGEICAACEAFPVVLVVPEDKRLDGDTVMKTRLSDDNFAGEIQRRFDEFVKKVME